MTADVILKVLVAAWFMVGRILVAVLLLWAGVFKLRKRGRFAATLRKSGLFGQPTVIAIVTGVPVAEVALAVWLIVRPASNAAAWCTVGILAGFTAYVATLRYTGREIPCGCFGGKGRIPDTLVPRNAGLACMVAAGALGRFGPYCAAVGTVLLLAVLVRTANAARRAVAER